MYYMNNTLLNLDNLFKGKEINLATLEEILIYCSRNLGSKVL